MTATTIVAAQTRTARLDMLSADTLTVDATGKISVSANAQAVRLVSSTINGASISNSGTIENTSGTGRAIRFETSIGTALNATIINSATGIIQGGDDAIQVQSNMDGTPHVTSGLLTITNGNQILSTTGQALDLSGMGGTAISRINNSGTISASVAEAIQLRGLGDITNSGTINGGSAAGYAGSVDGVSFQDGATGTVTNTATGVITADRHGVNGGLNSTITVDNAVGGVIIGRNGSGVGSDGSGTVTNRGTITGAYTAGVPNGDGDGVDIDFSATINNYGLIEGTGAAGIGSDGLPNHSEGIAVGGGTITNFAGGIIRSVAYGMTIDNGSQGNAFSALTVVNDGTIEGQAGPAVIVVSTFANLIDNGGTISSTGGTAIFFGGGSDTLKIRNGSSIIGMSNAEGGTDTLDYTGWTASGVNVSFAAASATGTGGVTGFEVFRGSAQADTFVGSSSVSETIYGGGGADTLTGGAGVDTFMYSAASDSTTGAYDTITDFLSGTDKIDVSAGEGANGAVSINYYGADSVVSFRTAGGQQALILVNGLVQGSDLITGANTIAYLGGSAAAETIMGTSGRDVISGGGGADIFLYNSVAESTAAAFDTITDFATGVDKIDVSAATGAGGSVSINYNGATSLLSFRAAGGPAGVVQVIGLIQGSDLILGANTIAFLGGTAGAETIVGSAGQDAIYGAGGADTLTGGAGVDAFVFSLLSDSTPAAVAKVTDFDPTSDRLDLRALDGNSILGGQQHFALTASFTNVAGQLIAYQSGGLWRFDGDSDGNGVADFRVDVATTAVWDPYADPSHILL